MVPTPEVPTTAAVQIKLPSFWITNPEVWFVQAEAQFAVRGVTSDQTKFYHVLSALDMDTAGRMIDFLRDPPADDKYKSLKSLLIQTFGLTRRDRANKLLHMPGLGDRKPSALMDEMLALLDGHKPCMLFEQLFLEQMPETIRIVLSDADFSNPSEIGKKADALWENLNMSGPTKTIHQVEQCESSSEGLPRILKVDSTRQGKSQQTRGNKKSDVCFYHQRFGKKATKCQPPCNFPGNDEAGRH